MSAADEVDALATRIEQIDELGAGADYTEVVKPLERAMGVEIAD